MPSQPMTPTYRMPFIHPHMSLYNQPVQESSVPLPYNYSISNQNYQNQYVSYNQNMVSTSFPVLPDNIDKEYIPKYLCPILKGSTDKTNVWIANSSASKRKDIALQNVKETNVRYYLKINKYHIYKNILFYF